MLRPQPHNAARALRLSATPNLFESPGGSAQEWLVFENFASTPSDSFWSQDEADLLEFEPLIFVQQGGVLGIGGPQPEHYQRTRRSQEGRPSLLSNSQTGCAKLTNGQTSQVPTTELPFSAAVIMYAPNPSLPNICDTYGFDDPVFADVPTSVESYGPGYYVETAQQRSGSTGDETWWSDYLVALPEVPTSAQPYLSDEAVPAIESNIQPRNDHPSGPSVAELRHSMSSGLGTETPSEARTPGPIGVRKSSAATDPGIHATIETPGTGRHTQSYSSAEWEGIKHIFARYYLGCLMRLDEVIPKLSREHNFHATEKAYKTHIRTWDFYKNIEKARRYHVDKFIVASKDYGPDDYRTVEALCGLLQFSQRSRLPLKTILPKDAYQTYTAAFAVTPLPLLSPNDVKAEAVKHKPLVASSSSSGSQHEDGRISLMRILCEPDPVRPVKRTTLAARRIPLMATEHSMPAPESPSLAIYQQQPELQSPNLDTSDDDETLAGSQCNDAPDADQEDVIARLSDSSDDLEELPEHAFNAIPHRADGAPRLLEHDGFDEVKEITEADFNTQARRTSANSTRADMASDGQLVSDIDLPSVRNNRLRRR
ncbi:hypothetical protein LTR70_001734 [Exophiala xenobiotica]|uniref:Clr5 domain-containing protein n=1 Tax=Lithohypha guttulata TaxID=1690604 RepID=A0ABR0KM49_9EURO|nr:hypothetical protein LTR24_001073 [Lithohypha guttulata]KAK5326992.1 hypothetical protein LTR70_001734 [Exophiala xenobiotica]